MFAGNFKTENSTYRKLIGNGSVYSVPRFQRDYSWDHENWGDLWQDILDMTGENGEPAHYMGYLVLKSDDDINFDIIDGQQRLTTLSIIILAGLNIIKKIIDKGEDVENNTSRSKGMRETFIGFLDFNTLIPKSKLNLSRNNNSYYQTNIVTLNEKMPRNRISNSENNLRKAFFWFEEQLLIHLKTKKNHGEAIADLIQKMSNGLFFTVIHVTDEMNAFKVFETLNSRGVQLSSTDLLKNYFFSILEHEKRSIYEIDSLETRWEAIISNLESEAFPEFLRTHWNSKNPITRKNQLFKKIRERIKTAKDVFELMRDLEQDLQYFIEFTDKNSSLSNPDASTLKTFMVKQPYSMLIAARRELKDVDVDKLLKACVHFSFRYNIIGNQNPREPEEIYNEIAQGISSGTIKNVSDAIKQLAPLYPNDASFKSAFAVKSLDTTGGRNNKVVQYILSEIEKQFSGAVIDIGSKKLSVEHIFPQNPESGWENFGQNKHNEFTYRIGNMALLDTSANRSVGNDDFKTKSTIYEKSVYALTRKISEDNSEWSPERLNARQNTLATIATSVWRIDQLS